MAGMLIQPMPFRPDTYTVVRRGVTAAEYFAMPEDDVVRHELLDGDLTVCPPRTFAHQDCLAALAMALSVHARAHRLGVVRVSPIDVMLSDDTVLQPDFAFFAPGHPDEGRNRQHSTHPPTLVVEVLAPDSLVRDRRMKAEKYRASGVPHYWIVDPERETIDAFALVGGEHEPCGRILEDSRGRCFSAPPFAGLAVPVKEVFEG